MDTSFLYTISSWSHYTIVSLESMAHNFRSTPIFIFDLEQEKSSIKNSIDSL